MENRYYLGIASDGSVTLQHHGIPGMKWGVRRTPEELGHVMNKYSRKGNKYTSKADAYEYKAKSIRNKVKDQFYKDKKHAMKLLRKGKIAAESDYITSDVKLSYVKQLMESRKYDYKAQQIRAKAQKYLTGVEMLQAALDYVNGEDLEKYLNKE